MKKLIIQFFSWWNGQTWGTRFFTWRNGELVGHDQFGNQYYRQKNGSKRWVIYKGLAEPSLIPAGWHGWMHHRTDEIPSESNYQAKDWELAHQPNLTGTAGAYRPKGSLLKGAQRDEVTGDYQAWSPES
ncbi:NADH:ubiquinone oxidoreductase subunit NDUFA12 [Polycladidibacter stylochi]|uniref:NADH:ubiquinone oxidoreductase subunit NDUFA12 n=1 Tax=Polycladidibacter stylochi TaxID=1807766 RepID=UPI0008305EF8|nr:NADH:ubiquinone oxidoreductase subunit NDUFA12 [Pseudovibrio stylochi]